ncbi:tetratricopeptide repeat protein [Thermobrachium celere]|uniref:tetratricopeptide repeat protein n=1 Tax=Thermobrachium celere TaxID=53422 RepID=UPI0019449357|nr:hypothetical protein [Thermobrachium celere]GFR34966.1 hypothetical protein TCEA9_07780 [Thermobrachium celere]
MTDKEKLIAFEKYMREKGIDEDTIKFNLLVVKLLINRVLFYFQESLETIDSFTFEEFTDMVNMIDIEFGGREGIPKMLNAMLELTEFLKVNKFIKGGKIAHYKRMFSNVEYYLEKYDRLTGKRDDTKEFIKEITTNSFSKFVIKNCEYVNNYDFKTMILLEKILNDIPLEAYEKNEETDLFMKFLIQNNLITIEKNTLEVTKKGRALSRLDIDDRYAGILYLMLFKTNWASIVDNINFDITKIRDILISIFSKKTEVKINVNEMIKIDEKNSIVEIASDRFRLASIEAMTKGGCILDLCFVNMGLVEIKAVNGCLIYRATELGKKVFESLYKDMISDIKYNIEIINNAIRDKNYDRAEKKIFEYLMIYGGNNIVWDYLAQLLIFNKKYDEAYIVLKNAYENSSKRGNAVKTILYHLVLVARKLKLKEEVEFYEGKLSNFK